MNCSNCGKENLTNAKFCKQCGQALVSLKEEPKPTKKSSLNIIFIYILMFFAVAEAVFIFFLLKEGNITRETTNKQNCPSSTVCETNVSNNINVFGGMITLPDGVIYDFSKGKLILSRPDYWSSISGGVMYQYSRYVDTKEDLIKNITNTGYKVIDYNEENILGKERLIINTELGTRKSSLIYTSLPDNSVLAVEFVNHENGDQTTNLEEFLTILDKLGTSETSIKFNNSNYINRVMGK